MKDIAFSLFLSLVITLIVELSLALLLKVNRGLDFLVILLVNVLTNPAVNYFSYWLYYIFNGYGVCVILLIIIMELIVVLIEFFFYKVLLSYNRIGKMKLSILLNGASFLAGVLVSAGLAYSSSL